MGPIYALRVIQVTEVHLSARLPRWRSHVWLPAWSRAPLLTSRCLSIHRPSRSRWNTTWVGFCLAEKLPFHSASLQTRKTQPFPSVRTPEPQHYIKQPTTNVIARAQISESKPINGTPLRHFLVFAVLKLRKPFSKRFSGVLFLWGENGEHATTCYRTLNSWQH